MTQKTNSRPLSGKAHPLHIQRKPGKPSRTSRTCCSSVLTVMALFIMNLSFQAKWLTNIPLGDFAVIEGASLLKTYGMMVEPGLVVSPWQCAGTLLYHCSNFWLLTTWLWSSTHVTPLIWLLWFLLLSEIEVTATWLWCLVFPWNLGTVADHPTCVSRRSVQAVLHQWQKLDPLHKFRMDINDQ